MKKYLCHYIVEAGKIIGVINACDDFLVSVETGDGTHSTIEVPKEDLNYNEPEPGEYFLRGIKGQVQVIPAKQFEEAHAQLFQNASSAKSFKVQDD